MVELLYLQISKQAHNAYGSMVGGIKIRKALAQGRTDHLSNIFPSVTLSCQRSSS